MNKNLKLSFILLACIAGIVIAFRNLIGLLSGAAISFIAMLVLIVLLLSINLSNNNCFNRTKDMFYIACGLTTLESIMFFAIDFNIGTFNSINGFLVYQNILAVLGLLFLAYIAFRLILEMKEIKLGFIEFILGNKKHNKKEKKAKELSNGTLEDKPNNKEIEKEPVAETENFNTEPIDIEIEE